MAEYTLRRIEGIVERALRESGALGVLPTPLEELRGVAGIRAVEPVDALPEGVRTGGREVLGAVWFEARTVYVEPSQAAPRRRFTEAHELVHALCPWHAAVLREDTEASLFRPVAEAIEAEANAGAGMLIFQGAAFAERAAGVSASIGPALGLAGVHGASRHATLHHFVATHAEPLALLTVGRFPRRDGSLPVWRSVESRAFARRHGQACGHYPEGLRPGTALHALAETARRSSDYPGDRVRLGESGRRLRAEAMYNRHAFLIMLAGA